MSEYGKLSEYGKEYDGNKAPPEIRARDAGGGRANQAGPY